MCLISYVHTYCNCHDEPPFWQMVAAASEVISTQQAGRVNCIHGSPILYYSIRVFGCVGWIDGGVTVLELFQESFDDKPITAPLRTRDHTRRSCRPPLMDAHHSFLNTYFPQFSQTRSQSQGLNLS